MDQQCIHKYKISFEQISKTETCGPEKVQANCHLTIQIVSSTTKVTFFVCPVKSQIHVLVTHFIDDSSNLISTDKTRQFRKF